MENNFKCNKCKHSFSVSEYRAYIVNKELCFKTKKNELISCPECSSNDISKEKREGRGLGSINKFSSMSNEQKKECLKERADKNFKGEVKEKSEYIRKNFTGQTLKM
jgi:hypothetical protein